MNDEKELKPLEEETPDMFTELSNGKGEDE